MNAPSEHTDRAMLDLAARAGLRGAGLVEPNPMVGCVIARPDGFILGIGHHRRFGSAHAEVEALAACRRAGHDARGATAWVTLEPCDHTGKTGPCTEALIEAGIGAVVIARRDTHAAAAGGAARLEGAGVRVRFSSASRLASELASPFLKRIETGLPWVIAKWAQTIDGRMATRTGDSRWISNEQSRRRVHRLRGMVDAVLTGVGTVLADDPMLTCRGVRARRRAERIVMDAQLRTSAGSALVASAREVPVAVLTTDDAVSARPDHAERLRRAGVDVVAVVPDAQGHPDMERSLRHLASERGVSTVLLEAGPALLGAALEGGWVDEAHVFIAPLILGDGAAPGPRYEAAPARIDGAGRLSLWRTKRLVSDVLLVYRRPGVHLPVGAS